MKNKKIIRFVESFLLLPVVTMGMPLGITSQTGHSALINLQNVSSQTEYMSVDSKIAYNQALEDKQKVLDIEAEDIDSYFRKYNMPLLGTGKKMAEEADKNGLDWRLMPAISVRESTGGKHACTSVPHSFFGWGSCRIGFNSDEEAIEALARNLSGNDADTAKHYLGKTTKEILQKYNPPSVVPKYADQVMRIMDAIGDKDIVLTPNA